MGKLFRRSKGPKGRRYEERMDELDWVDFDEGDWEDYEDDEAEYDEVDEEDEYYEDEEAEYYEEDEEEYDEVDEDDEYYEEDEEYDEIDEDGEYYEEDEEYDEIDEDGEYYEEDEEEYDEVDEDDEYYEEDEEEYDEADEDDEYYEEDEEEYDEIDEDDEYYEEDEEEYDEADEDDEYYEEDEEEYDEIDEDDEYYEEDEEDYDEEYAETGVKRIINKIANMSATDHIVALTGAAVLLLAVVAGTIFFNTRSNQAQIETFAEIGNGIEDITVIGESGLVAISDAQAAKLMAAAMEEQHEEEPEEESEEGKIEVTMNLTSIQKDLKIKFINSKSGKLIPNIEFTVEVEKPSGGTITLKDDDKDGIIYQTNMEPGRYQIKMTAPVSDDTYRISDETTAITVRDTIEYKKVDVSNEVKTEAQVNAAVEDTKVNETVVESANTDTVEWVESTKTLIEGTETSEEGYEKVEKSQIADPAKTASLSFMLLTATDESVVSEIGGGEGTDKPSEPAGDPTAEPTAVPIPDPIPDPTAEPTAAPTPDPTAVPTLAPTAAPTLAPTAPPTAVPTPVPTLAPTIAPLPTATPVPTATANPTATASANPTASPTAKPDDPKNDTTSILKTTSGETLWVKDSDGKFREAKYADYYTASEFYRKTNKTTGEYRYTGWQEIDGATYFFDKNGNKVTGEQVIQGAKYNFNSDGSLNTGSGHMGIDVSKWNGNIDWNAVKNSGVSYVIIRCGYRGSTTGALIEDPMFRSNIQGASSAGLKVGVYFFTQAVNEVEAVEEASMVLGLIKGYNISYPVFLDVEPSNGRADSINASTRTAVCKAFCQTIQNSGYKAGIYANKTWLNSYVDAPSLTGYKIWLAQYAAAPTYNKTRYDMWQYSSKGSVAGIKGSVDMNISYMGY